MRNFVILLLSSLFATAYAMDAEYEAMIDYQLRKGGPAFVAPNYSLGNSAEVRAADNWLRNLCEGFDKVDQQNKFLPTPLHGELYFLHKQAIAGDVRAREELGDRYVDGRELPKDWKAGICWYRSAAQKNSAYAEFWLAIFYQHGWIVKQSAGVASHWFTLAARHHNTIQAEREVADRYADDDSGIYDMGQALVWYERAAHKGNVDAELALGNFYITSHTPSDIKLALSWYEKASAKHSVVADYNIGQIYYRGVGIPQNLALAHKWLLRAAERGYKPAQYDMAQMYYRGEGVKQDWVKSYAWLEISGAAKNNPAARELEDMLITHFNPAQLKQASHLARDYKARYAR